MGAMNALKKMFNGTTASAVRSFDEYGQPIKKKSMEEHLLEKHQEREYKKKVKAMLDYYEKKHYREMTSTRMPYHKVNKKKGVKQLY